MPRQEGCRQTVRASLGAQQMSQPHTGNHGAGDQGALQVPAADSRVARAKWPLGQPVLFRRRQLCHNFPSCATENASHQLSPPAPTSSISKGSTWGATKPSSPSSSSGKQSQCGSYMHHQRSLLSVPAGAATFSPQPGHHPL